MATHTLERAAGGRASSGSTAATAIPAGIWGTDQSRGGLPQAWSSLVSRDPSCGTTEFASQTIVKGRTQRSVGLSVAFANGVEPGGLRSAASGWAAPANQAAGSLALLDAYVSPVAIRINGIAVIGVLASFESRGCAAGALRGMAAPGEAFLMLFDTTTAKEGRPSPLFSWLSRGNRTGRLTAATDEADALESRQTSFLEFAVDSMVMLGHGADGRRLLRGERSVCFRGMSTGGGQAAQKGLRNLVDMPPAPGGETFRGLSLVVSGEPCSTKRALRGAYIDGLCRRDESTLFLSAGRPACRVARDLSEPNVAGLGLARYLDSGMLRVLDAGPKQGTPTQRLAEVKRVLDVARPRHLIIEPSRSNRTRCAAESAGVAREAAAYAESLGCEVVWTSLPGGVRLEGEPEPLRIAGGAEPWMRLSYVLVDPGVSRGQRPSLG